MAPCNSPVLSGASSKAWTAGTHRTIQPQETLDRIRPHLAALGVTRVANVTGLDRIGVPVVMVCRPNSRSLAVSQGKGLTLDAAKASGLMESIELLHAERVHQPQVYGSLRELETDHEIIDLGGLPSVKGSRWSPTLPTLWTTARTLDHAAEALAPFEVVHASAARPLPPGSGCFLATSNGLASGNTLGEAVLHGLCEIIERDATTLWEARGAHAQAATRVALDAIHDPECCELLDRFEASDFDVAVFETTSDIGLPAFLAEISDRLWDPGVPLASFTGMGCHTARNIALSRALTEAAQCRLTMISGARDDLFREDYDAGPSRRSYVVRHAAAGAIPGARDFGAIPDFTNQTIEDDLRLVEARLAAQGVGPAWYVDLTRPEFGLPVARVLVPGLEGPDEEPDYVPGARAAALAANGAAQ